MQKVIDWLTLLCAVIAIGCGSNGKSCKTGSEGCACNSDKSCNSGLSCRSSLCVNLDEEGGKQGDAGEAVGEDASADAGTKGSADARTDASIDASIDANTKEDVDARTDENVDADTEESVDVSIDASIISISVCGAANAGDQRSCPEGTFDTRTVVFGPNNEALNESGVGGVTDEHASVFPPGSLQGNTDYLFFVAAGTDLHPGNIGVVALSGGSGPNKNGQWTLDFAPGYGSYMDGYGQIFSSPIEQNRCPTPIDKDITQQDQTFDLTYAAAGSLVPDPTGIPGSLLMIYEGCNACIGSTGGKRTGDGAYISVGVATSVDYGRTWPTYRETPTFDFIQLPDSNHDQGPSSPFGATGESVCMGNDCTIMPSASYGRYTVLSPPVTLASLITSGSPGSDAAHDSEPSAFLDDIGTNRYIYEVHNYEAGKAASSEDEFPDGRNRDLTVARAELNGGTEPLQFLKWDGQSFSQPGIGGHEVQILPDGAFENCEDLTQAKSAGSISYVKETRQYLLTFVCHSSGDPAEGTPGSEDGAAWFYATTDDLSHQQWSTPREIVGSWMKFETGTKAVPYGCLSYAGWYPTFMSLGRKPGHLALHGYVFSLYGCLGRGDNPPQRLYVSHAFTITIG
jgi:hypothetical protein